MYIECTLVKEIFTKITAFYPEWQPRNLISPILSLTDGQSVDITNCREERLPKNVFCILISLGKTDGLTIVVEQQCPDSTLF